LLDQRITGICVLEIESTQTQQIKKSILLSLFSTTCFDYIYIDHYQEDKTQVQQSAAPVVFLLDIGQYA
jgi:hypothetical protein